MKFPIIAVLAAGLAGCTADPLISDYNGASVKIQTSVFAPAAEAKAAAQAQADRICAKSGKKAEYASSREIPGAYVYEHLYLCL